MRRSGREGPAGEGRVRAGRMKLLLALFRVQQSRLGRCCRYAEGGGGAFGAVLARWALAPGGEAGGGGGISRAESALPLAGSEGGPAGVNRHPYDRSLGGRGAGTGES